MTSRDRPQRNYPESLGLPDSLAYKRLLARWSSQTTWQRTPPRDTSRLWFIPLCNPDLPVPRSEIQLSKHCCLAKLIKTVGDKRNGIVVPNGHLIECSVVYAHSKRAILLLLKKRRCAIRWLSWETLSRNENTAVFPVFARRSLPASKTRSPLLFVSRVVSFCSVRCCSVLNGI